MPGLAGALGLLVGVIVGGLGGGGGVLTVPALVYLLGQSPAHATTGSVVIVGIAAVVGVASRLRGDAVDWRTGAAFGVVGVPAAAAGALAAGAVPAAVLLLSFSLLTIVAAGTMLMSGPERRPPATGDGSLRVRTVRRAGAVVAWGLAVGFLTGFLGVGGGFLVVPVLVIALRMPLPRAIGTSLVIITVNAAASLISRAGDLELDWGVVGPFAGAAVVGTLAGKAVGDRLSGPLLTRAFAVLVGLVGLAVGVQSAVSLAT